jgi:suppressor for copper-sensitivity B
MRSPVRLLIIAFLLAVAGTLLRPARAGDDPPIVRVSSTLTRTTDRAGQISVTADIADGFHIYALSQPRPFLATRITVSESTAAHVTAAFTPSQPPRIVKHPTLQVELHEYEGQVTWTAPVVFSSTPSAELILRGTVFAQACQKDRCLAPKTYEFQAHLRVDPVPSHGRSGPVTAGGGR